jgi:RNA 3'-terminal phosphate cyclase-like protein
LFDVSLRMQGSRDGAAAAAGAAGDAGEALVVPEDIGRAAAQLLLEEVSRGGVTDGTHQGLLLLMAALGPEEMNEVGTGLQDSVLQLHTERDGDIHHELHA